jgi:8-oxo-dGTP pyrophosphatase MutT (NUDIX family)
MKFKRFLEAKGQDTAIIAVMHDNKVLILRRGKTAPWQPLKWNLPGGVVDSGESYREAAIRECKEEAGITPQNVKFVGNYDPIYAFSGTANDDNVTITATHGIIESDAWDWVSLNDLNKYDFAHPVIPTVIKKVLSNPKVEEPEPKQSYKPEPKYKMADFFHSAPKDQFTHPHDELVQFNRLRVNYQTVSSVLIDYAKTHPDLDFNFISKIVKLAKQIHNSELKHIEFDIEYGKFDDIIKFWDEVFDLPIPEIKDTVHEILLFWETKQKQMKTIKSKPNQLQELPPLVKKDNKWIDQEEEWGELSKQYQKENPPMSFSQWLNTRKK